MEQSEKFKQRKERIKEILKINGKERPGFTDEHYNAITASYIYLDEKYPGKKYNQGNIDDHHLLSASTPIKFPASLAGLYLARVIANVKKVTPPSLETDYNTKAEYVNKGERRIEQNEKSLDDQIYLWPKQYIDSLSSSKKQTFQNSLRQKVILHEFYHAGSALIFDEQNVKNDTGYRATGLLVSSKVVDNAAPDASKKYYDPERIRIQELMQLEELITEKLALDTLGQKIGVISSCYSGSEYSFIYPNQESSNRRIYVFAEILTGLYGEEILAAKFCGAKGFLEKLNEKDDNKMDGIIDFSKYAKKGVPVNSRNSFVKNLEEVLHYLKTNYDNPQIAETKFKVSVVLQADLLKLYYNKIKGELQSVKDIKDGLDFLGNQIPKKEELQNTVDNIVNISEFLSEKKSNPNLPNRQALGEIVNAVKELCTECGVNYDELRQNSLDKIKSESQIGGNNCNLRAANPGLKGEAV